MSIKFVIASTGRAGSGYISQVLNECGIKCGHEQYFTPPWKDPDHSLDGDSSWLSIDKLNTFNGTILHQVRDPLDTLSSYIYMYPRYMGKQYVPLLKEWMTFPEGNRMESLMNMLFNMNYVIEVYADYRYKVENITPNKLQIISKKIGFNINPEDTVRALKKIPNNYNNKGGNKKRYSWDELPDCRDKELLIEQYKRYGYTIQ